MSILKRIFNVCAKAARFFDRASTGFLQKASDLNDDIVDHIESSVEKNFQKASKHLNGSITGNGAGGGIGSSLAFYFTPARYIALYGNCAALPFAAAGGIARGIARITRRRLAV